MGLLSDLTDQVRDTVASALPEARIIHDPTRLRPALAAGNTVVWIGPPESIDYEGYQQGYARYEIAVISPATTDPIAGLDETVQVCQRLQQHLSVERITPDSLTIGNGPAYPAALAQFTLTFQET